MFVKQAVCLLVGASLALSAKAQSDEDLKSTIERLSILKEEPVAADADTFTQLPRRSLSVLKDVYVHSTIRPQKNVFYSMLAAKVIQFQSSPASDTDEAIDLLVRDSTADAVISRIYSLRGIEDERVHRLIDGLRTAPDVDTRAAAESFIKWRESGKTRKHKLFPFG